MVAAPKGPTQARQSAAASFVEQTVARIWPGTQLEGVDALRGDASTRSYLRCRLRGDGRAPSTLVAMVLQDASVALSSEELSVFGEDGPQELPFVNVARFLSARTDAAPTIYAVAEDHSVLVLEDVGDTSLWETATRPDADGEVLFGQALDLLASLQDSAQDDGSGCYAFRQAFDERLFAWELEHFLQYGLSAAPVALVAMARKELAVLATKLAALPRVFCHRDFHAWNIHYHDGRLRVIDHQDALLAPALYDVASLLTDRTTANLVDAAMEGRLVERFYAAQTRGRQDCLEDCRHAYSSLALQRALKVIGRFRYLHDVKGKSAYLSMLGAEIATAQRMLARFPDFPATAELIEEHINRDGADS